MYYVFYVNDGYMLALDLAPVGCFRDLHEEIRVKTGVQPKEQVFFLSGGEALIGDYLLSTYSDAGTETNPVYFIKRVTSEKDPINSREKEGINNLLENWKRDVERVNQQPQKSTLVSQYVQLAEDGTRVSETLIRFCAKSVAEHQYLNQGWNAVTRNLDENVNQLATRYSKASRIAQRLPTIKKKAKLWVTDFELVFNALLKIKIPSSLLSNSSTSEPMSLYDWISSHDSESTLEQLIEHVSDQIDKLDDTNLAKAGAALKVVKDLVKRKDYRDIRGIDKRLATLDNKLTELEESHSRLKEYLKDKMSKAQADTHNFRVVIAEEKEHISKLTTQVEDFTSNAHLFLGSKMELLKNVRQRLGGWIKQGYDRLQVSNTDLIVFEQKFSGFRQRLDLVRQIREAPILYVASVAEVIRRNKFKTEFDLWLNIFSQKASEFLKEENTVRAEFYVKLEKHFLREIFSGMADELPNFIPTKHKFDSNIPQLSHDELRALRETLKDCLEMNDLFKVTTPQVFTRLAVDDPSNPGLSRTHSSLHREASFFTKEQTRNIQDMGNKFPSTNWLSEEGQVEHSPSTQSFLSRTLGSTTSLNAGDSQVTTPSDLVPSLDQINVLRRDSSALEIGPSSVDLTCPMSIHPDRFPKVTSPMKIRKASRGSTPSFPSLDREYPKPIFEEGVPVDSPPEDGVFMPDDELQSAHQQNEQETPLYTPNLSPVKSKAEIEEKSCQTMYGSSEHASTQIGRQRLDSSTQFEYHSDHFQSIDTQANFSGENVGTQFILDVQSDECQTDEISISERLGDDIIQVMKNTRSDILSIKEALLNVKTENNSDLEGMKREFEENIRYIIEKISGNEKYNGIVQQFELKVDEVSKQKEEIEVRNQKLEDEVTELKKLVEHEKHFRKEKESEANERERRLKVLNEQMLVVIREKEEGHSEILRLSEEIKNLKASIEHDSNEDCLNIELDVAKELLKRDLSEDEIEWMKTEIEKRKNMRKTDAERSSEEDPLRKEYENAYKNKMAFLLKGIEEKKNAEISKIREEMEKDIREEYETYTARMKARISELEEKVKFYEKSSLPISTSATQIIPMDESIMEQSCMVVDEDVINIKASSSTLSQNDTNDGDSSDPTDKGSSSPYQSPVISPDLNMDVNMNSDMSTNEVNTQTKLKMSDMKMMISLHEVREGSGVLLVYNDVHASFMVFSTTGTLYFVKPRSLRRLGIDQNNPAPKFTLLFARVLGVELCETKKAPNRYNLAANTRFYRVDVAPMPATMAGLTLQISAAPSKTSASPQNIQDAREEVTRP
ncbi:unnamed protein product [Bursaphelenchus xylophilus]|uniref:(pine wood nematode) hypothetical protein n=1 Tax=Bursaphelenchus xylophilus TaxID=6326 RepID=A0A1I7STV9_BURXY|nr:unnamed protein product [Bursaphelenchus xylophilus]CAG9107902.1 unnamed protein product [Bursaphelenchus xylophilus]